MMSRLTVRKDNVTDSTLIPNCFIDIYMKDANDAQLKVYLYLTRMLNSNQAISVSDIADKFNHTEKDITRALEYWEKSGLLDLEYDSCQNLVGIELRELTAPANAAPKVSLSRAKAPVPRIAAVEDAGEASAPAFAKPAYTPAQLREFKNRENTAQLLFIAESYMGKPLSPAEMKSILFFSDELHFSDDLIDYLIQYCLDRNIKSFSTMEKVAIEWAQRGVTTPKQVQQRTYKYERYVYDIMNKLGKSGSPTDKEMEYINRWTREYALPIEIIFEACDRTVLAVDKNRFLYAEKMLHEWKLAGVHNKADIQQLDDMYHKKKRGSTKPLSTNRFNQFPQNSYDFDALEQELLSN